LRSQIESAFDLDFSDLRETPERLIPNIDYAGIEADVSAGLSMLTGRPVRLPE
jgi:hypothetical protein